MTWRAIPLYSLVGFCLGYSRVKEKRGRNKRKRQGGDPAVRKAKA